VRPNGMDEASRVRALSASNTSSTAPLTLASAGPNCHQLQRVAPGLGGIILAGRALRQDSPGRLQGQPEQLEMRLSECRV